MWLTEKKSEDPADRAYDLIQAHPALEKMINKQVAELIAAMVRVQKELVGHAKYGGQHLAALHLIQQAPLSAAKDLEKLAQDIVGEIEGLKESVEGASNLSEVLSESCSREAFEANISAEIKAGKPKEQAVAIAISTLKKACGVTSDKRMSVDEILKGGMKEAEETRRDVQIVVERVLRGC